MKKPTKDHDLVQAISPLITKLDQLSATLLALTKPTRPN